jgi:phenylalanyl-tRNA synthetase beta chain
MLPGLLNVARFNLSHGAGSVGIFESALVFTDEPWPDDPRLPNQTARLAWVIVGEVGPSIVGRDSIQADADVSLSVLRHVLAVLGHTDHAIEPAEAPGYHPGRTARVRLAGRDIGHVGELSPRALREFGLPGRVAIGEVDLQPLLAPTGLVLAVSPSVFPHVDFDLSFLVPAALLVQQAIDASIEAGSGLVESARVFDEFHGPGMREGERAVAIRYRLRSSDHTLSNEEVSPVREAMIQAVEALGARLRGA